MDFNIDLIKAEISSLEQQTIALGELSYPDVTATILEGATIEQLIAIKNRFLVTLYNSYDPC